jgi:hypothetical protein
MRAPALSIDGIRKWRWQFATQRLRDAYDASRSALDDTLRRLEREDAQWKATKPDMSDPDEKDAHEAWLDHIIDRFDEAQSALETIKQGFAVILYHSWEKHAIDWVDWKGKYHHGHVTGRLKAKSYLIDPGVHKLRKVANTIKHDSNELWLEDQTMFKAIVGQIIADGGRPEFARFIQISDDQLNGFFDALMASGAPGPATPSL